MKAATANTPAPMIDGLTRDQRFFLSFGAAPSNLPAYAAAFSCKPGQPMVRRGEKQVVIW